MHHTADILIVGAGPAGCAAAYDLARAGCSVLLLDKRSFPRHKACACGLTRKTLKVLRYSVDPVVERVCRDVVLQEAGTAAFAQGVRVADKSLEVRVHTRQPFCATAVRERFDNFCLEQTLAAGPHIALRKIEGIAAVRELATHAELDITLPDGSTETLTAAAVLGADGSNGQMRRLAAGLASDGSIQLDRTSSDASSRPEHSGVERPAGGIPTEARAAALPAEPDWYARGFALEATVPYAALPSTLPAGDAAEDLVFDFAPISGGYGWLFPKGDHINIGVGGFVPQAVGAAGAGTPGTLYEQVTRTLLAGYTRHKLGVELGSLPGAHVTGQYLGLGGHAYTPQGRVLLAGDAAGLVDPLTGEGIHSAIVSGQAFAAAVLEALPLGASSRPAALAQNVSSRPELGPSMASSRPEALAQNVSSRPEAGPERRDPKLPLPTLAAVYARHLRPLQETLAFSHRAAQSFYREPSRGFRVMRTPLLRRLMLKTYADGLPHTELLAKLARRVA